MASSLNEFFRSSRVGLKLLVLALFTSVATTMVTGDVRIAAASHSIAVRTLEVHPAEIELRGPFARQRVVVLGILDDGTRIDMTAAAEITVRDAGIASVAQVDSETRPAILPGKEGETRIEVSAAGASASISVRVRDLEVPRPMRFADDVVSHLTRAGCNSGSCHGAQYGKGGLKLSLLGYEPDDDYITITREAQSRRVALFDPERSLMLLKPLNELPHEGGQLFVKDSLAYQSIVEWLKTGAPGPRTEDPAVESIEVLPKESVLAPGGGSHLLVMARLSDGSAEDVTGKAQLETLNDGVATIDNEAKVTATGSGATAIMVRYAGQAQTAGITVPYRQLAKNSDSEPKHFIDRLVAKKWSTLGLLPSELSGDAEFLRRLYVSAIGTLPTPQEVQAFLDESDPGKRDRAIDRVLERPEYVDYWSLKWGDVLRIHRASMGEKGMWSFYNWIRAALKENRPLDQMVQELITAQGSTFTTGPANYFRVSGSPNELAEITSQVFLGLRMQCAQCHHHPFEKWSQNDYYGMAAYFSRLGVKRSSDFGVYGTERVVFVKDRGEVRHPKTNQVVSPKPLDAPAADDPTDRRRALARWLTSKDNRLFARNMANRFWGYVMGRGLVEPIDDLRVTNPPSNPELLDALAEEFVSHGFDQKHLLKTIFRSRTFQLSSRPLPENKTDDMFYSHYPVKRLPAEVLLDAIVAATQVSESFSGVPKKTRAIQLPDPNYNSYFLQSFGKPKRAMSCECERVSLPNMAQALHLMNGDFIHSRIVNPKGRVGEMVKAKRPDEEAIRELYFVTFSRPPTDGETSRAVAAIAAAPSKKEGLEDLLWALCNATEFLFNH